MTTIRQNQRLPYNGKASPSIQPSGKLIFSEQFNTTQAKPAGDAGNLPNAMQWPRGWRAWDRDAVIQTAWVDGARQVGAVQVKAPPHTSGAQAWAGMIHAMPAAIANPTDPSSDQAFHIYSNCGLLLFDNDIGEITAGTKVFACGLFVSSDDLSAGDGKFVVAGQSFAIDGIVPQPWQAFAADWLDHVTPDVETTSGLLAARCYVRMLCRTGLGGQLTSIRPSFSLDCETWQTPILPDNGASSSQAGFSVVGRLQWLGIGGSSWQVGNGEQADFDSNVSYFADYVHVYMPVYGTDLPAPNEEQPFVDAFTTEGGPQYAGS